MGSEQFWDNLWERVWNPLTWAQIALILLTMPVWVPIVRALWREVQEVLAPFGGLYGNKAPRPTRDRRPGEDPFAKIPIARRRRGMLTPARSARGPASNPRARASATSRGTQRPRFRSTM